MSTLKREIVEADIPCIHELVRKASKNQNGGGTAGGTFNPNKPVGSLNYDSDAAITDIERLGGMTNHSYKVTLSDGTELLVRIPGEGTEEMISRADERKSTELPCRLHIDSE